MGEKLKVGIFIADFDPISMGDLIFAQERLESLGLSKVVFVPQKIIEPETISIPWLDDVLKEYDGNFRTVHASDLDRIEMVKLAVSPDNRFEYSDCLLNGRTEKNKIKGFFNGRHEDWKLYFLERDDCDLDLKDRIRYSMSLKYYIQGDVIKFIEEKEVYKSLIRSLSCYVKGNVNQHRFSHSVGVTKAAIKYAKRYDADETKAELAGIFHDACKVKGAGLEHGPNAAELLKEKFGIFDEDVYNAIKFHTTSRPKMCLLEKVIKMADLLEEGREFDDVEDLRNKMTDDVDESTLLCLKEEHKVLIARGVPYDKITDEAIKWLDLYCRTKVKN